MQIREKVNNYARQYNNFTENRNNNKIVRMEIINDEIVK